MLSARLSAPEPLHSHLHLPAGAPPSRFAAPVSYTHLYFIPFIYLNDPDLFSLQLSLHELLSAGSANNATVGVGDVLVVEESLKYATVLVSIAPLMCVYPFLQKYFVKGVMIGAVKGLSLIHI